MLIIAAGPGIIVKKQMLQLNCLTRKLSHLPILPSSKLNLLAGQYSGNQIPDVPDQLAHAGITYQALGRFKYDHFD